MDVVADLCVAWFGERWRATSLLFAIIIIILPLSLIEKINSLRFTSYVGIAIYCTFALTAGVLFALGYGVAGADSPAVPPPDGGGGQRADDGAVGDDSAAAVADGVGLYGTGQLLVAFPIVVFAFACHTVIFHIRVEFTGPGATSGAFLSAMRKALVACFLIYAGVGLFGCLSFGFRTRGDVLKNYSALAVDPAAVERHGAAIARAMEGFFCISVCLTYPLVVFPLRASLLNLLGSGQSRGAGGDDLGGGGGGRDGGRGARNPYLRSPWAFCCRWANNARSQYGSRSLFYGCTIVILAVSYATAILLPQLEVVLGLSGATMGVAICYVYPALMYLRATDGRSRSPLSPVRRRLKGATSTAASDSMHVPLRDAMETGEVHLAICDDGSDGGDTAAEAGGGGEGGKSSSTGSSDFDDDGDHAAAPPPKAVPPPLPRWVAFAVLFISIPAGFASFVQAVSEMRSGGSGGK